jgi:hypothetical protein
VGSVNITHTLHTPKKTTTGYQVTLWADKTWSDGKKNFISIDFQEFTAGDYEAAEFLVLCLNRFKKEKNVT